MSPEQTYCGTEYGIIMLKLRSMPMRTIISDASKICLQSDQSGKSKLSNYDKTIPNQRDVILICHHHNSHDINISKIQQIFTNYSSCMPSKSDVKQKNLLR